MTTITPKLVKSSIASFIEYRDLVLQNTGVTITNESYDAATDRVYDVRTGASIGIAVQFFNKDTSGVALEFSIQTSAFASIESDLSDIPEDTWLDQETDISVATNAKSAIFEYFRADPAISAVRLRIKVAEAGSVDLSGIIGWF